MCCGDAGGEMIRNKKQEIIEEIEDTVDNLQCVLEFLPDSSHLGVYADRLKLAAQELTTTAADLEKLAQAQQELNTAVRARNW